MKNNKLAVVAGGWHFPLHFFRKISEQKIPKGWSVDLFCVSHRNPIFSAQEKETLLKALGHSRREEYDRILYEKFATVEALQSLGWNYIEEPNTVGDWGTTNQWLAKNDFRQYDKFLFTHDDNYILNDRLFMDVLPQSDWLILSNSTGHAQRRLRQWLHLPKALSLRGSFEFFTREMLELIGGSFDMSRVSLNRENIASDAMHFTDLSDWNNTVTPLIKFIKERKLNNRIRALSRYYRMSIYCLEGERGFIHKMEKSNIKEEEKGLDAIEKYYDL